MTWDPDFESISSDEGRDISREWDEVDWADIAGEAELELINSGIVEQSEDRVRTYLANYGDVASDRVDWARIEAERLLEQRHPDAALAFACIGAEIAIRFLIVRPLLGGIIFSDIIAERVAARVAGGRTTSDRELLPFLSQHWGLEVEKIRMSDGAALIRYLNGTLWTQRDGLMHRGQAVTDGDAERACEGARLIVEQIVVPLSHRLRLPWPHARWSFPRGEELSPFVKRQSAK